jgi:hypothetical protein
VNEGRISFVEGEREILRYTNGIGSLMTQEVLEGVREPTVENRLEVRGKVVVYEGTRNLRFFCFPPGPVSEISANAPR